MAARGTLPRSKAKKTTSSNIPRSLLYTDSTSSDTSSPEDNIEVIPADIPTDRNVGQSTYVLSTIASTLERKAQPTPDNDQTRKPSPKPVMKRSASSELLKIENLDNYMMACAEYSRGVRAEMADDRLLAMVAGWRAKDVKTERN